MREVHLSHVIPSFQYKTEKSATRWMTHEESFWYQFLGRELVLCAMASGG